MDGKRPKKAATKRRLTPLPSFKLFRCQSDKTRRDGKDGRALAFQSHLVSQSEFALSFSYSVSSFHAFSLANFWYTPLSSYVAKLSSTKNRWTSDTRKRYQEIPSQSPNQRISANPSQNQKTANEKRQNCDRRADPDTFEESFLQERNRRLGTSRSGSFGGTMCGCRCRMWIVEIIWVS